MEKLAVHDGLRMRTRSIVRKYHQDIDFFKGLGWTEEEFYQKFYPYEVLELEGNCFLNEGIDALWSILCETTPTEVRYTNAIAEIGVGDSTTAADASQTDLQAATNKTWKAMDGGYPTFGSSQKATFRSSFGASDANYAWQEWSVRNGSTADKNLNRKVESLGTKSGGTWQLTVELSIT